MESNDAPWMAKAPEDERLCWSFLLRDDWLPPEVKWAKSHLDTSCPKARAWALGPLAKLSELEEFRAARMFARMQIWRHAFGAESVENPYWGPQGAFIDKMFDEDFARKVGQARADQIQRQAGADLLPLAQAMGRDDLDAASLGRMAKLRCCENMAPESASSCYIGALAIRALSPEEERLALMFLSPKIHPGKRSAQ